ncbi:hypothetical protein [Ichthyenterobacterium magnum]|uniref:Uncharacterized protein n=1 Tax=Ichthyenterobacterium magnum TaxID=1230530 RepID=A0A420DWL2_9FLAO|nr:hypothetical protein [Ichthyenterobacterium magnum]RKE98624.1 hypothetical protein BXY80_0716 [Ichthyenterobacterium magnum]
MKKLKKTFSVLAVVFFMSSTLNAKTEIPTSYEQCMDRAEATENQLLQQGASSSFAYNYASDELGDCIDSVDEAAAEYWLTH